MVLMQRPDPPSHLAFVAVPDTKNKTQVHGYDLEITCVHDRTVVAALAPELRLLNQENYKSELE
jgi:hypothetical protein